VTFRRPNEKEVFSMRDLKRIPQVLQEIERVWQAHPDWRLGQLICNLAAWADPEQNIVWDVEDEVLVAEAKTHLAQLGDREAANGAVAAKT
jgi:uncharacterized protein YihD (DUF1040 family)